jgi:predicted ATP-grasp superfamily ATP-dependent carboligase
MNYPVPSLWRIRPVVNAQAFVWGRDANCTVACWQGTVLASITVSVLETVGTLGPASVIRVIDDREISAAAEAIVRHLRLSGLIGLDFILEEVLVAPTSSR